MFVSRQRILVCVVAALSLVTLLHVHAVLDATSVHCNACIQQSHAIVAHSITISEDHRVQFSHVSEIGSFPARGIERPADPRAPPV